MRRENRVFSRDAIENAPYGFDEAATPNAIEVLTHRLRKKTTDKGASIVIHNLRGIGNVLQENLEWMFWTFNWAQTVFAARIVA